MGIRTEDYLKAMVGLEAKEEKGRLKGHQIATRLGVSASAVTEMLQKLAQKGYLNYAPYKGVTLTHKGRFEGANMIRRHRLLELFLHQHLNYSWDEVHQEAEQLEHAASDQLINRLDALLGFPRYDPHGAPIPDQEGALPDPLPQHPLKDCPLHHHVRVVRVKDTDPAFLQYLDEIGLTMGSPCYVLRHYPFDNSLDIQLNEQVYHLTAYATERIWVAVQDLKNNTKNNTKNKTKH